MSTFTVENKDTGATMEVTEEQWRSSQLFKSSNKWRIKKGGGKAKAERPVAVVAGKEPFSPTFKEVDSEGKIVNVK